MNLALILGNGFDLNIGLPTSYSHFYKYYLNTIGKNQNRTIKDAIANDLDNWSDLEAELGKISLEYKDYTTYIADIEDLSEELTRYLREVDVLPITDINGIAQKIYEDLLSFPNFLDLPMQKRTEKFLNTVSEKDKIDLSVVTFNYTSVFEKIIEHWKDKTRFSQIRQCSIHHIHQDLNENGIILGVNDVKQISNTSFHENYSVKATVVKPFVNESFQSGIDVKCREVIAKANVIILFGLSMGDTDRSWWKFIGNNMYNKNQILIYCPYDNVHTTKTTRILCRNRELSRFVLKCFDISTDWHINILPKIMPLRENNIFKFGISQNTIRDNHERVISKLTQIG